MLKIMNNISIEKRLIEKEYTKILFKKLFESFFSINGNARKPKIIKNR